MTTGGATQCTVMVVISITHYGVVFKDEAGSVTVEEVISCVVVTESYKLPG